MRLVHTFTSNRCSEHEFYMHMAYFILSCIYAKQNGFEIVLHCDKKTYEILQYAPYDEIILDLEGIVINVDNRIFAWPKFKVMESEPLGSIHIDGDVLLKSPELLKRMDFTGYDVIVQNYEEPGGYSKFTTDIEFKKAHRGSKIIWQKCADILKYCEYPKWAPREIHSMYNCGIIGFNNQDLKKEYFDTYWLMLEEYSKHAVKNIKEHADLILEQQFLYDLCKYKNYKVKEFLDSNKNLHQQAKELKYQHVFGSGKMYNLNKVLKLIKKYRFDIFEKIIKYYPFYRE